MLVLQVRLSKCESGREQNLSPQAPTFTYITDTNQEDLAISSPKLFLKPTTKALAKFPRIFPTIKTFASQNLSPEVRIDKCPTSGGTSWGAK